MQTYGSRFEQVLIGLLDEEIDRVKENISHGAFDLPEYKTWTGHIAGLRKAIDLCADATEIINKD